MTDPVPFSMAPQEYDPFVPVAQLHEHPENPNEGDTEAIAESLDKHGFYGAIIAQKSTGQIIAGNHRFRAAVAKGADTVPAFMLDVDDDEARRILAVDNRTTHLATFDEAKLIALLTAAAEEERGLSGTGYDEGALAMLVRHQESVTGDATDPSTEWTDMPEFDQPDGKPYLTLAVHFPDEGAVVDFFALLGRERPKQRFFWWPQDDGFQGEDRTVMEVSDDDASL